MSSQSKHANSSSSKYAAEVSPDMKWALILANGYPKDEEDMLVGALTAAKGMKECLIKHLDFKPENIMLKLDTDSFSFIDKSASSIQKMLWDFVAKGKRGEIRYIHILGYGVLGLTSHEMDFSSHNCFVTSENKPGGPFINDNFFRDLVDNAPDGVDLTLVCDFCYSGGILRGLKRQFPDEFPHYEKVLFQSDDGPQFLLPSEVKANERRKIPPSKSVFFIHSAHKWEYGYSQYLDNSEGIGHVMLLTHDMMKVIESYGGNVTYMDLLTGVRDMVAGQVSDIVNVPHARQRPGLSCSDCDAKKYFLGGNGDPLKGFMDK